jgi:phosphate transport system substrate-binding protein
LESKVKYYTKLTHAAVAFAMSSSLAVFCAGTAAAEPVSLTAHDSYSKISGDLIAYKDGIYIVRTALGDLRVKASSVECEGPGCPVSETLPKV